MSTYYPLFFEANLHKRVWGGHSLLGLKGLPESKIPYGESWEVSAVPDSPSIVANGEYSGMSLVDVINQDPVGFLGAKVSEQYEGRLPLLVKFIDAKDDLSIQVHPNDKIAKERHNCLGKTEMWYVIDARPGAYLYNGFNSPISKYEYAKRVEDGTITDVLARHDVKAGDVFYIPAGQVHAICGGVVLAEVQQSSDITYRIFDYNRLGLDGLPRQLHTDEAMGAIDFDVKDDYRTHYSIGGNKANHCIDSPYFKVRVVDIDKTLHRNLVKYDSFIITTCVSGSCSIIVDGINYELTTGNSCLIPAAIADYYVEPHGHCQLLDSFIDNKDRHLYRKALRFLKLSDK